MSDAKKEPRGLAALLPENCGETPGERIAAEVFYRIAAALDEIRDAHELLRKPEVDGRKPQVASARRALALAQSVLLDAADAANAAWNPVPKRPLGRGDRGARARLDAIEERIDRQWREHRGG